jgi:hypothetical protein
LNWGTENAMDFSQTILFTNDRDIIAKEVFFFLNKKFKCDVLINNK